MTIIEKAAYIRGLADGLKLSEDTTEGKILKELLELTSELAKNVDLNSSRINDLEEYCDELDEDLSEVESAVFEEDEEYDEEDSEEDDTSFYEATCPYCGETVCFDESIDPEDVSCPNCGKHFMCELTNDENDENKD